MKLNLSSLRAKRSNPLNTGLPRRAFALLAMTCIVVLGSFSVSYSQEDGLLAQILAENCAVYLQEKDKAGTEYQLFCSGYFEALIEQKQNSENINIYACKSIYGDYNPFKSRVIEKFIEKYELIKSQKSQYVRAFSLAHDAINEQYVLECRR